MSAPLTNTFYIRFFMMLTIQDENGDFKDFDYSAYSRPFLHMSAALTYLRNKKATDGYFRECEMNIMAQLNDQEKLVANKALVQRKMYVCRKRS